MRETHGESARLIAASTALVFYFFLPSPSSHLTSSDASATRRSEKLWSVAQTSPSA